MEVFLPMASHCSEKRIYVNDTQINRNGDVYANSLESPANTTSREQMILSQCSLLTLFW